MKSAIKPNTDLSLLELCRGETDSALAKILIYLTIINSSTCQLVYPSTNTHQFFNKLVFLK